MKSPRIEKLNRELALGNRAALEAFWQTIAEQGAPLIEPIEGDDAHALVTFLWRGGADLKNVFVMLGVVEGYPDSCYLERLPGADLWYKSFRLQNDLSSSYIFVLNNPSEPWTAEGWVEHQAAGLIVPDPLNPDIVLGEETIFVKESVLRLPGAAPEPWIVKHPDVPAGQVYQHVFTSQILSNERKVWVYTPPGYSTDSGRYGWVLFLDGGAYYDLGVNVMLDNLIAQKRIPPIAAIFVRNASHAERHVEMSCNPKFAGLLVKELLPWVRRQYHITDDPGRTIIVGESYSGLAAPYAALCYPDVFGNVLAQSGAYYWYQGMDREPDEGKDTEPGWLIRQFVETERLPLRFHIDVGLHETARELSGRAETNMLSAARHLRDVLRAKGYPVRYVEFNGGHDFVGWRGTLPEALVWLANPDNSNQEEL